MAVPTIVFDLDGTLVDTAPDLIATLNALFAREGLPPPGDELRNMIGGGARQLIEHALARESVKISDRELERLYAGYIRHYAAHIADCSRPFPGLEPALDALAAAGCRLAVCTNKLEFLAVRRRDGTCADGRRLGDRHPHGARGGNSGGRGRFRLYRDAGRAARAGPDHQPVRRSAGGRKRAVAAAPLTHFIPSVAIPAW